MQKDTKEKQAKRYISPNKLMIPARGPQTVCSLNIICFAGAVASLEAAGSFWRFLEASGSFWKLQEASGGFWKLCGCFLETSGSLWRLCGSFWRLGGSFLDASGSFPEASGGFCSFVEAFWKPLDAIFLQFLGPGKGRHTFRGSSADARRMAASVVGASLGRHGGGSFLKTSKNPSSASTVWGNKNSRGLALALTSP